MICIVKEIISIDYFTDFCFIFCVISQPTPTTDPMALPVPQHVSLNHLYCTAIKDGMMVLGATQRYKEKFFTVVFYSVMPGTAGAHWWCVLVDNNNRDVDVDVSGIVSITYRAGQRSSAPHTISSLPYDWVTSVHALSSQSTSQPVSLSVSQPASQPVCQSVSQSI